MDYQTTEIIELSDYGMEGQIIMGLPMFTRRRLRETRMASLLPKDQHGRRVAEEADAEAITNGGLLMILSFIRDAPFKLDDVDAFNDFMNDMDLNCGRSEELWARIYDTYVRMSKGEGSPLPDSQDAETTTSA